MGPTQNNPEDLDYFSFPFILISLVFFSLYLFLIAMIIDNMIPGTRMLFFPESGFFYRFNGTFIFAVMTTVSCAGGILLVMRMKERSHDWKAGLPLCILTGFISASVVVDTFYEPSIAGLRPLAYSLVAGVLGYALLPACAAYFLFAWKKTGGVLRRTDIPVTAFVGILGILFCSALLVVSITDVPSPSSPGHDDFLDFSPAGAMVTLFGLFYGAVLLPVAGLIFLARGLEYRRAFLEPDSEYPVP